MKASAQRDHRPLYNSRIIDNYIKLIKKKYDYIDINALLQYAAMKPYEVADQGHWFSQWQINRFHEKLSQLTHNKEIAREAGRFAASPESNSVMRQFFLGMVGAQGAYELLSRGSKNFTRSTIYKSRRLAANKVEVVVTPKEHCTEEPFQCENRTGYLESIAMGFCNKMPRLEHPECIFKGGDVCRYIISWEKSISDSFKRIRNATALLMVPTFACLSFFLPMPAAAALVPAAVAVILILTYLSDMQEKTELRNTINSVKHGTDQLVEMININYNNALLTNDIGQAISRQTNSKDILLKVIQIFRKRLDYDRCMILLADKHKKRLLYRAGYGYTEEQLKLLKKTAFHLDRYQSKGIFVVCFKEQKPFLINDISEIENYLSLRSLVFAKKLGSKNFICSPIIADGASIGILAVDNMQSKNPLVHSDLSLLIGIASVLGISIKNADLLEARERQFRSILHTLAASIDARDPMTSGHSEKVTEYAVGICEELKLSREYCEMIRVAALLHDYGKIGVPDAILKKPGRLTDEEYDIVKTHAEKTKRILEEIHFEGIFNQVPEVAGAHHERYDGTGYPNGIRGEAIPLGARIIAVADFFEAITARRHYRDPMQGRRAFELLRAEAGKRFDSRIVDAFCSYYERAQAGEPVYPAMLVNERFMRSPF
jgi:HD-GYP domain-containing protein (c-di-GMP phosphodiesterase class II)